MKILDHEFKLYIGSREIEKEIDRIAGDINRDYRGKDPLFIGILNGAFIFAADLIRKITLPSEISFLKVSSYEMMQSSEKIKELIGLDQDIEGRDLIILEDIIDTGLTLKYLLDALSGRGASSIEIASLFLKPESFRGGLDIRYIGFEIPNQFIVGYGLDYNGYGRNLKNVYILNK